MKNHQSGSDIIIGIDATWLWSLLFLLYYKHTMMPHSLSLSDPLSNLIVPGLENVPAPNKPKNSVTSSVPRNILHLSSQSLVELDTHVEAVRIDVRRFDYTRGQQGKQIMWLIESRIKTVFSAAAMNLIGCLNLYIPTHNKHDMQNKYSIIQTDSKFHTSKKSKSKNSSKDEDKWWKRFEHVYQCQCGVDHMQGRFAASENKCRIPWRNVGCWAMYNSLLCTMSRTVSRFLNFKWYIMSLIHCFLKTVSLWLLSNSLASLITLNPA